MSVHSKRALLANSFGTLGYVSCLLLWVWVAILYLPMALDNEYIKEFVLSPREEVAAPTAAASPSLFTLFFALIITVAVMAITVIILVRIPMAIAKTGRTLTTKAADSAVPFVARGKPLPAKEKRRLTVHLIKLIKLLLVLLPVIAGSLGAVIDLPLSFEIVMFVIGILALAAVFWFSAQYICANILGVKPEALV